MARVVEEQDPIINLNALNPFANANVDNDINGDPSNDVNGDASLAPASAGAAILPQPPQRNTQALEAFNKYWKNWKQSSIAPAPANDNLLAPLSSGKGHLNPAYSVLHQLAIPYTDKSQKKIYTGIEELNEKIREHKLLVELKGLLPAETGKLPEEKKPRALEIIKELKEKHQIEIIKEEDLDKAIDPTSIRSSLDDQIDMCRSKEKTMFVNMQTRHEEMNEVLRIISETLRRNDQLIEHMLRNPR